MTVEEAVRTRLLAVSAVTALASTRVYLDKLPQAPTYPAVRVQLIDDPTSYHLRGPDALSRARVQVDAFASETSGVDPYAQTAALASAIHGNGFGTSASGLSGWKGSIGSPAFEITAAFRVDRRRGYVPDELRVVSMSQDYFVWYRE